MDVAPTPICPRVGISIPGYKVGAKVGGVPDNSKRFLQIFLHKSYMANLT